MNETREPETQAAEPWSPPAERDIVMLYWQHCALQATELYPVPNELVEGASVAAWLGGNSWDDKGTDLGVGTLRFTCS